MNTNFYKNPLTNKTIIENFSVPCKIQNANCSNQNLENADFSGCILAT
jgi:uncharacterized protein YjbI with pentapeptide repeats